MIVWDDTALHRMTTDLCESVAKRLAVAARERAGDGVRIEQRGDTVVTDDAGVKAEYGARPWALAAIGDAQRGCN